MSIPKSLLLVSSLKRLKNDNFFNSFVRYLSRHGLKSFSRKLMLKSTFQFLNIHGLHKTHSYTSFQNYFFNFFFNDIHILLFNVDNNAELVPPFSFNNLFHTIFSKINLIFSFYIYKVDKHIYKNSRGRSGKFTFIWKYVAPYKRHVRICYWLMKEVRVAPGKTLRERLSFVVHNFLVNPKNSLIWKIKKFSLNYSYYNLRNSLLETYRTTPK